MNETKFTEGEWSFNYNGELCKITINGNVGMYMLQYYPRIPSNIYDWHLMASSPRLYEALDNLVAHALAGGVTMGDIEKAQDALAQARGEI